MATLDEVLNELIARDDYEHHESQGGTDFHKVYTFWFSLDSDHLDDIDHYTIDILVKENGEAKIYTTNHIQPKLHTFRNALQIRLDEIIADANYDFEYGKIEQHNEKDKFGTGKAVKTADNVTTIVKWVGFYNADKTAIILRIID